MRKGREVLNRQKLLISEITITAIDLHLLDVEIERCKVGDSIRVVSEPHGLDDYMVIQRVYLDLLRPENSKLTLGATAVTLASSMSRGTAAVLTSLSESFTAFKHVVTDKLQATNADIGALHTELAEVDTLLAQKANITDLNATNANVANLQAADVEIRGLVAEKAGIEDLRATQADVQNLTAATGNIESLLAGNAGVGTLQAIHLNGDNLVIEDAAIAQAVMADLMAGRVSAAAIYTDFVKIGSRDGSFSIDGATMQIKDANGTVRVQIGRDAQGGFSYYLWDGSGNLIWSPEGITADGVPDGLIVDSMVADDAAIDGSKLNIRSVARELTDDGTLSVDAAHVVMDDTTLEANYKTITKQIGDNAQTTQTLQTEVKEVQGKIQQKVWQSDITEATTPLGNSITELSDKYTSQQQTIEGITTEIGDVQTSLESKADGSTVQALTARVNRVEESADGFSRSISEIKTDVAKGIVEVTVYYALNDSETVPPAEDSEDWSTDIPAWTEGSFMWQKTVTVYASGTSHSDISLTSWYEATSLAFEKTNDLKAYVDDSDELLRTYAESIVSQKADEIQLSISTVTGTLTTDIQDTKDALAQANEELNGSVDSLTKRVSDQEDALLDYKHETSTYFRFNANGLNIGKQEDGDESPYSINLDNEKMAFLQNGNEIAYVQYNKMHINAIEAMDRLSVGAAADGGYFDFISTIYGMGVKWRAVKQTDTAELATVKLLAKRAAEYKPVQDDDGIFTVDFGGDGE